MTFAKPSSNPQLSLLIGVSWLSLAVSNWCFSDERVDFARHVKPILDAHCVRCHGPDKQEGGMRLDRKQAALRGGDSYAPAIVPGKSSESPLFQFVSRDDADLKMPPQGPRVSSNELDVLRRWIDLGAVWSEEDDSQDPTKRHWAFQPLRRPEVPPLREHDSGVQNSIDHFVIAKLQEQGLTLAPRAPNGTLIRRLSFDLVGLPPTPEEVQSFNESRRPLAYEELVDGLLATPRFGERWARHWLDVVRFAESHGFEMNQTRPNAWRFRDYVIAAFNEDLPYDRFVRDQLAGDRFGADEATGFLVGGPWDQVKSPVFLP